MLLDPMASLVALVALEMMDFPEAMEELEVLEDLVSLETQGLMVHLDSLEPQAVLELLKRPEYLTLQATVDATNTGCVVIAAKALTRWSKERRIDGGEGPFTHRKVGCHGHDSATRWELSFNSNTLQVAKDLRPRSTDNTRIPGAISSACFVFFPAAVWK